MAVTILRGDAPFPSTLLGWSRWATAHGAWRELAARRAWDRSCRATLGVWRQRLEQRQEPEQRARERGQGQCVVPCATVTPVGTGSRGRARGTEGERGPGSARETQDSVSSSAESNKGASRRACPGLGWQSGTWGVDAGPSFPFLLFHSLAVWTFNKMLNLSLSLLACKMGITVVSPRGAPWGSCETICWCAGLRTQLSSLSSPPRPAFRSPRAERSHGAFRAQLEGGHR